MALAHYSMPISPTLLLESDASKYLCVGDSVTVLLLLVGPKNTNRRSIDCLWDCCVSVRFVAAPGIQWVVLDISTRTVDTDSIEDWDFHGDNSLGHHNSLR